MELIISIISLAINIIYLYFIFWIISNIKGLNEKFEHISQTRIKYLWEKIDKLEERIKELENKNTPE